jgi:error-prone DNA polymerase
MNQTREDPPLQTLSRSDEKGEFTPVVVNKKTQVRKPVQTELFPSARNFK